MKHGGHLVYDRLDRAFHKHTILLQGGKTALFCSTDLALGRRRYTSPMLRTVRISPVEAKGDLSWQAVIRLSSNPSISRLGQVKLDEIGEGLQFVE